MQNFSGPYKNVECTTSTMGPTHYWKWTIRFPVKTHKLFIWNTIMFSLQSQNLNSQKLKPREFWVNPLFKKMAEIKCILRSKIKGNYSFKASLTFFFDYFKRKWQGSKNLLIFLYSNKTRKSKLLRELR